METEVSCQHTEHCGYAISIKTIIRGIIWEWEIWVIPCKEAILMKLCFSTQISLGLLLPTSTSWNDVVTGGQSGTVLSLVTWRVHRHTLANNDVRLVWWQTLRSSNLYDALCCCDIKTSNKPQMPWEIWMPVWTSLPHRTQYTSEPSSTVQEEIKASINRPAIVLCVRNGGCLLLWPA